MPLLVQLSETFIGFYLFSNLLIQILCKTRYRVKRRIGTVGELGSLIRRIGTTLFQSKVVLFARQSGSNCLIGQILSDNWNHLVGQLEPPIRTIGTTRWF